MSVEPQVVRGCVVEGGGFHCFYQSRFCGHDDMYLDLMERVRRVGSEFG